MQGLDGGEWLGVKRLFRDPRRMLKYPAQRLDELCTVHLVDLRERHRGTLRL